MNNIKALIETRTFKIAALQALIGAVVIFQTAYPADGWLLILKSVLDMYLRKTSDNAEVGGIFFK